MWRGIASNPIAKHVEAELLTVRLGLLLVVAQALDVVAEGDGKGARRTLSRPSRSQRLALEWPVILGIILAGIVMAVLTAAVFARRRTRRAYEVLNVLRRVMCGLLAACAKARAGWPRMCSIICTPCVTNPHCCKEAHSACVRGADPAVSGLLAACAKACPGWPRMCNTICTFSIMNSGAR